MGTFNNWIAEGIGEKVPVDAKLPKDGVFLDRVYIPARCPNGWASGSPMDFFDEEVAKDNSFVKEALKRGRVLFENVQK